MLCIDAHGKAPQQSLSWRRDLITNLRCVCKMAFPKVCVLHSGNNRVPNSATDWRGYWLMGLLIDGAADWWGCWLMGLLIDGAVDLWGCWLMGLLIYGAADWWGCWLMGLLIYGAGDWWGCWLMGLLIDGTADWRGCWLMGLLIDGAHSGPGPNDIGFQDATLESFLFMLTSYKK